ncbi:TIGR03619 family F420-dependent LLM class oxidoreductase [Dactylosporangium sp. NPDC051485]|uniref:TIGR03619 family F420-dependent LLM class oxidoreductase n=1 Tax=Dactylosporangium sp. NPDC051485 TaxID=3154846 RepID=UPI00343E9A01
MKFGFSLEPPLWPEEPGAAMVQAARDAERIGLHYVLMSSHVLYSEHGAAVDPLVLLSAVAGATSRIGLATSVLVLPYYHPVVLANQVASLDMLSGGRLTLGVGTGWNPQEFAALDVPVRQRGRRTDDSLEVMQAIWSGTTAQLPERFGVLREAVGGVRPASPGGPPIWVGGHSDASIRRAVRFGAGWHGSGISHDQARSFRARIDELAAEAGRDPSTVEISTVAFLVPPGLPAVRPVPGRLLGGDGASTAAIVDDLSLLGKAGVTMCSLWMPIDAHRVTEALEWFASDVLPRVAEL